MTSLIFHKYQGAGNDFVMIDNRIDQGLYPDNDRLIRHLCDRRFGIGADGLILLNNHVQYDFEMLYFNADGCLGSLCGNGARCAVAFARYLGIISGTATQFLAVDGPHEAHLPATDWIELKMGSVDAVESGENYFFLNTGSPHYILFVDDLEEIDVVEKGRAVRYSERFREEGVNVNFVEATDRGLTVATYERGVEAETLSCGTGVTAAALAYNLKEPAAGRRTVNIRAKGGDLQVRFQAQGNHFTDIWLCGPAKRVFEGKMERNYTDDEMV